MLKPRNLVCFRGENAAKSRKSISNYTKILDLVYVTLGHLGVPTIELKNVKEH